MSLDEVVECGALGDLGFTKREMWEFAELDDVVQNPETNLTLLLNFIMVDLESMEEI